MQEDRTDVAEVDEDGGGGDEEYEINDGKTIEYWEKRNALWRNTGNSG